MRPATFLSAQVRSKALTTTKISTPARPTMVFIGSLLIMLINWSIFSSLTVYLRYYQIKAAQDSHGIGQHVPLGQFGKNGQIGKRRNAPLHPVWFVRFVTDDIDAQFTAGSFHDVINISFGRFKLFGRLLRHNGAFGQSF